MTARKHIKYISVIACLLMFACGNTGADKASRNNIIESVSAGSGTVKQGASISVDYKLAAGKSADSVVLFSGNNRIGVIGEGGFRYAIPANQPTGRTQFNVVAYKGRKEYSRTGEFTVFAAKAPELYGYRVVNTYDHAPDAYTQGLLWHEGYLYESTGLNGGSSLRKTELSGEVLKKVSLGNTYFAEGLALFGGKLYQITWQSNKAFVYDLETFEKTGEFNYKGDGWGLTEDGTYLYMTDGSEKIYVRDPATFEIVRVLEVYTDREKRADLNELEYINGEIWANLFGYDTVVKIDPETGAVTGIINFSGILPVSERGHMENVMNGIAYDREGDRIFVTGKRWAKLFEVEVFER